MSRSKPRSPPLLAPAILRRRICERHFLWHRWVYRTQCVSVWHATEGDFFIPLFLLLLRRTANPPLDSGPINALLAPTRHAMTEQDISHRRKKKENCFACRRVTSDSANGQIPNIRSVDLSAHTPLPYTHTHNNNNSQISMRTEVNASSSLLPSPLVCLRFSGKKREGRSRNERTNGVCGESKWREEGSFRLLSLFAPYRP